MKFTRFTWNTEIYTGVLKDDGAISEVVGDIFHEWKIGEKEFSLNEVKLLSPIVPNQVIGIGKNYVSRIEEVPNEIPEIPALFLKPTTSVVGTGDPIVIPKGIEVIFESELAIVIGREAKNINEEEALEYVFGYTIANDVTAPQFLGTVGWVIGKAFDTFTPLGPFIETELNPQAVQVKARLNGIEKQNSPTELMIVPIRKMISYLSTIMTLKQGDVILTGTPLGTEMVRAGDVIECEIKEIGVLRNLCISKKNRTINQEVIIS